MSLFSALSSSLSGLSSLTTQLQVVSNNISNAGTDGYTKKSAVISSVSLGGGVGGGVSVSGYTRSSDDALSATLNDAVSEDSLLNTQSGLLEKIQTIFGTTSGETASLSTAMTNFANAWSTLAAEPENSINQQTVVDTAETLVSTLNSTASDVEALNREVQDDIQTNVDDLNTYLSEIANMNAKISELTTGGNFAGDLEDQRDKLVQEVSKIVDVEVLTRANGQIALSTPSGSVLVDGGQANTYAYDGTNVYDTSSPTTSLNSVLTGGSLEAYVDFCRTTTPASTDSCTSVIQKLRDQLDLVADSLLDTTTSGTFGYAYATATGSSSEAASVFSVSSATVTDTRFTIQVNTALVDGTQTVKRSSASAVSATFEDATRSFTADGYSGVNKSYETLVTGIVANFQSAATKISDLADTASSQVSYLKEKYANETGVSTDTETVNLTTLENAYAACAHVMQVIQNMFDALENIS